MKAIILAAGRGSRMGTRTDKLPKCRTVLHGKELIEWQMQAFRQAGIDEIGLVRGYLPETFTFNLTYFENERWSQTNMVSSLLMANEWLERGPCISSYSDIVFSSSVVSNLMDHPGDIVISYDPNWLGLWTARFEDPLSDAETLRLDGDIVVEIGNKTDKVAEIEGQYMGLIKFTPNGWNQVQLFLTRFDSKKIDKMDMTTLISAIIFEGIVVNAVPVEGNWYEVDSESDLKAYLDMPLVS